MEARVYKGRTARRVGHDKAYTATQTPSGYVLHAVHDGIVGIVTMAIISFVWIGATALFVMAAMATGSVMTYFIAGVGTLFTFPMLKSLRKERRIRKHWAEGELHLAVWPTRIGERQTAWYTRPAIDGSPAESATGRLILRESATYRQGTDTHTATEDVATIALDLVPEDRGGVPGYAVELAIPGDAPPTIELDRNLVEWIVEFTVNAEHLPEDTSMFLLRVQPEVAP